MKAAELRAAATCAVCRNKFGESGLPLFFRVTLERFGVDLRQVQRVDGFAQYMGNTQLAELMGDNPDVASPVMEPVTVTVCETCGRDDPAIMGALASLEK